MRRVSKRKCIPKLRPSYTLQSVFVRDPKERDKWRAVSDLLEEHDRWWSARRFCPRTQLIVAPQVVHSTRLIFAEFSAHNHMFAGGRIPNLSNSGNLSSEAPLQYNKSSKR